MTPELTFSHRLGDHHYEVRRITFQTIKQRGGFSRLVTRERHTYYVDGVRTPKRIWFRLRDEARMTDEERAERDAKKARIAALLTEISGGRL